MITGDRPSCSKKEKKGNAERNGREQSWWVAACHKKALHMKGKKKFPVRLKERKPALPLEKAATLYLPL